MHLKQENQYILFTRFTGIAGGLVMLSGCMVIIGWAGNIASLKSLIPGYRTMVNPSVALLFLIGGGNLVLLRKENRINLLLGNFVSSFIILVATMKLASLILNTNTGVDQLLFRAKLGGDRMSPTSAINFLFTGMALLLSSRKKYVSFFIAQVFACLSFAISLTACIGHLYAARTLASISNYIPMAFPTAITFVIFSLGILFTTGRYGFMSVIMNKNIGGKIARILLPITLVVPIILGWLLQESQREHVYDLQFAIALTTILSIAIFTILIWTLAWSLNKADEERKAAEQAMLFAKLEAEQARRTQEQFLANMSHEIRTPINGVIGMTQLVKGTLLNQEQEEYIEIIGISANNLLVIINDILDIAKINSGKIDLEMIDYALDDVLKPIIKIFELKAKEKQITFRTNIDKNIPPALCGDPVKLSQVLTNLINNAIKFTEKGEVVLSILQVEDKDTSVSLQFSIQDTGIGIAEDKVSTVFDSFIQASTDTTRKYGGTGLGLTISKQLVELFGGNITVTSRLGEGSLFTFTITIQKGNVANLVKVLPSANSDYSFKGIDILLAEDNIINQKVASILLSKQGAAVDIANNGREVLEMLALKKYHLILMDVHMPEMDGYEATMRVRSSGSSSADIPIIALTASALASEKHKCINAGMNDYLSKPFNAIALYEMVSEYTRGVEKL
jgi:signal transduction histidine kinase/ActR/RegA family two-component response regulator